MCADIFSKIAPVTDSSHPLPVGVAVQLLEANARPLVIGRDNARIFLGVDEGAARRVVQDVLDPVLRVGRVQRHVRSATV